MTVSKYLNDLLIEKFNSDTVTILNGIDFSIFNNPNKVFNDPPVILFTDHILENKNTKTAIETAIRIHEKYPDVRFRCFGRSRYHSMPEYIEFIADPVEEEITELYRGSDIFLFTSLYEGFGLPPAEAMACRCALAGNRSGAVPEFTEHLKSAMLASPENPDELFSCVDYLLSNRNELKRISDEGYKKVRDTLNWDRSVNKFEVMISDK
ncbi:MAG: glycosyltransferase family 4 protein [Ignavibacteria bacterium]|nr:glycosyltransferase family 4 protein [Ignavibacteria bacterium]